jgi:hypothetical protein
MLIPDIFAFEERAALAQFDGGLSLSEAEDVAAVDQGFADAQTYWRWLTDYAEKRAIPT